MKHTPTGMPLISGNRSGKGRSRIEGSALLTAVIFSFVVMMVMGSYLYLSSSEYKVATRSYLFGASFNLAEGGIDLALDALRDDDSSGWTKGSGPDGKTYWARAYTDYDLGANITGEIKVVILGAETTNPEIFTEGIAKGHMSGSLSKQLRVDISSGFYPFMNGFESKRGVVLKGNNVVFDSYDSRVGSYGPGNRNSAITISTISVESDSIDIGNADVYGFVATGGAPPDVGPKGSITDYSRPGVKDQSRITTDYYAEFPDVKAPSLTSPSTGLPPYGFVPSGEYLVEDWSMSGNAALYVVGDVTVVAKGDMSLSGNAGIYLAHGASLRIYVEGDADLSGNGIANASAKAAQLMIFGTASEPGAQTIKVSGNGFLAASVYAPNAYVELKGGGRILGAVAGYDSRITGDSHFSYDEAMSAYNLGGAGYSADEWVELSGVSMKQAQLNMADFGL